MTHRSRLMLLPGSFSLLASVLFVALPGRSDDAWRTFLGVAWLVTGGMWLLAYRIRRHDPRRAGPSTR